jgi:hypothetical protein
MSLRTCGSYKSANHIKDWVRKSQIRKELHLRNVRKSNKLFKSESLRIFASQNLLADRPPLVLWETLIISMLFYMSIYMQVLTVLYIYA